MKDYIKMLAPNTGANCYAKNIEHAERMINMFGYKLNDERFTQQGKQVKKAKAKKKDSE
jgi:hypothetical protein